MNDKQFKIINMICLIGYIILLTSIMYISAVSANVGDIKYIDKMLHSLNLVPFKDMGNIKNILSSIIIYMPLAILLPNCFNRMKRKKCLYLSIILIVLCIEVLQVVTLHGYGDMNDILFGLLGVVIMYELIAYIKLILDKS